MRMNAVIRPCLTAIWIAGCAHESASPDSMDSAANNTLAGVASQLTTPQQRRSFERDTGLKWEGAIKSLRFGKLDLQRKEEIQRQIESNLKPVPITSEGWKPVLPQTPNVIAAALSPEQSGQLLTQSQSVGRIVHKSCPAEIPECFDPVGTMFVIGPGLAATNCHVVAGFVEKGEAGQWRLRADRVLRVDFGVGPASEPGDQFRVFRLAGCSPLEGYDVAFLEFEKRSVKGRLESPPPLELERRPVQRQWGQAEARVYTIGYPNMANPSQPDMIALKKAGKFAKLASPGVVIGVEPHGKYNFLLHSTTTDAGNSGSPLIDLQTFRVIGIHNCCQTKSTRQSVTNLPCSTVFGNNGSNLALATWNLVTDPVLKTLLPPAVSQPANQTRPQQAR